MKKSSKNVEVPARLKRYAGVVNRKREGKCGPLRSSPSKTAK